MKEDAIRQAHAAGAKLIISADCGIRAHEVVATAHRLGIDIIITDHHLPEEQIPPALAVLNPKRSDCAYPEKNLAGVGVAFKLVQALLKETGRERALPSFMKVAAIGTIADLVPLIGENRIIAKFGLDGLRQPRNEGLRALLDVADIRLDRPIRCDDIAFRVGPRLNAMGRMGRAHPIIELFWAETAERAQQMARTLDQQNAARQHAQQRVLEEAHRLLERDPHLAAGPVIVLAGREWHRGVIGLAASKTVDRFYRPPIIVSVQDGLGHGSGRSIPSFHLLNGLDHCADLLERYGGHAHAAGLTIREEHIPTLAARLNQYAHTVLSSDDLIPELEIEHWLSIPDIDFELWTALSQLEPFGVGNPKPVFAVRQGRIVDQPRLLKEQHWMFRMEQQGRRADVIWWNGVERAPDLAAGEAVSVAFTVDAHHYRGTLGLRLTVKDLKRGVPSR
ncbi:MAG: single-stranded-DNA-specific exonuclease RecJ [Acidobacteria bacterium]|nr:MAG: single-stranded-DNA-specific exonuclease RecJ [Acidobacteriota bacterium]